MKRILLEREQSESRTKIRRLNNLFRDVRTTMSKWETEFEDLQDESFETKVLKSVNEGNVVCVKREHSWTQYDFLETTLVEIKFGIRFSMDMNSYKQREVLEESVELNDDDEVMIEYENEDKWDITDYFDDELDVIDINLIKDSIKIYDHDTIDGDYKDGFYGCGKAFIEATFIRERLS